MPQDLFKTVKGEKIKKTPEEIAQEQQAGQDFIHQREQLAMQQGISSKQAGQELSKQTEQANPPQSVLDEQARQNLRKQEAAANVEQALIAQKLAENQTVPQQTSQQPKITQPQASGRLKPVELRGGGGGRNGTEKNNINFSESGQVLQGGGVSSIVGGTSNNFGNTFQTAAQIYDTLKSSLVASKSTDVKIAEASFIDAAAVLQKDIELVKSGSKPYNEADRDLRLAEASIKDLEKTTKGLGKVNLRYWLSNGKEIEAQIIREQRTLENLRFELELARQTARVNLVKTQLGIQ